MQSNHFSEACPFCGKSVEIIEKKQIEILRAIMLSKVIPALSHDVKSNFYFAYHLMDHINSDNLIPDRKRDIPEDFYRSMDELKHFIYTLQDLHRARSEKILIKVSKLPKPLDSIWDLFGLHHPPDVYLSKLDGQIRYIPYSSFAVKFLCFYAALTL